MNTRHANQLTCALAGILIPLTALQGVTVFAASADQVRDVEQRQEQLRAQTQRVAEQIDAVILDFQHNGLGEGQDVDTLRAIRGVLGQLSEKQMAQVIQLLQQARSNNDPAQSRQSVTKAVAGQQDVISNLRVLLTTYKQQQALYQMAARFGQLADRQEANLSSVVDLVQTAGGKTIDQLDPAQRDSISVQQAQQAGIKDDSAVSLNDLRKLAGEAEGKTAQRLAAAMKLATDQKLVDSQSTATSELGAGNLFNSAKLQRTSRDTLREIARLVTVLEDDATRLKQASDEIDKAIQEQKRIADATKNAKADPAKTAEADKAQAKLVDKTDTTRKNLQDLAPVAADKLKQAEKKMQDTRLDLKSNQSDDANLDQKDAIAQLEEAKKEVDQQIATADKVSADPKSKLEETRDLLKEVQQIHKEQDQLKANSTANTAKPQDAAKQADLKKRTDAAQQQAAATAPAASKPLNNAGEQMSKAADAMKGVGSPASPQNQASDQLAKAEEALKKQVDELAKADDDLKKVEEATADIVKLIVAETAVEVQTAVAAAQKQPTVPIAGTQQQISVKTLEVKEAVTPISPPASAALADADKDMQAAKSKLEASQPLPARESEKEALADLRKAKDLLDQKADELKKELGQPNDPASEMADAAKKIDDAAKQAEDAANKLEKKNLQQQQQEVANQLKDQAKNQPENKDLQKAQAAAQKASEQLAKNDPADAAKSMQEAKDALDQAQQAAAGDGKPQEKQAMSDLGKKQDDLKQQAEQAAAGQPTADAPPQTADAGKQMEQTAKDLAKLGAEAGDSLPQSAKSAMEQAKDKLTDAAADAAAGKSEEAKQGAEAAKKALAQAKAAMAMAAGPPDAPGEPGPGNAPGKPGPPGPPGPPNGQPSPKPGDQASNNPPPPNGNGDMHESSPTGQDPGAVAAGKGANAYISLPKRDRQALQQSQGDKVPQEYGPMVEQYLRNLAEEPSGK